MPLFIRNSTIDVSYDSLSYVGCSIRSISRIVSAKRAYGHCWKNNVYSIFYKGEALFKNTELISKFKVGTPTDLVLVLLTPDEIDTLFMAYDNLINNVPKEDEIKN